VCEEFTVKWPGWKWRIVAALVTLGGLTGALTFCVGGPGYYSAKYAPAAHAAAAPAARPGALEPGEQTEPHTCGLHAMSSLYRAYGVDPEAHRLRFRLGTDMPANWLIPDSRGTIHPDLLRVLRQDGFEAEVLLDLGDAERLAQLRRHLEGGQCALTLIRTEASGALHWVVLSAQESEPAAVSVCDSLSPTLYARPLDAFVRERVSSVVLVSPR